MAGYATPAQRSGCPHQRSDLEARGYRRTDGSLGRGRARRRPAAFESKRALFGDTMTFYQWLQFVLLPRVREIIDQHGAFPAKSAVGAYAAPQLREAATWRAPRLRKPPAPL
ncbi:MAG: YqcC family protein [Bryobacteraceae bacterium]